MKVNQIFVALTSDAELKHASAASVHGGPVGGFVNILHHGNHQARRRERPLPGSFGLPTPVKLLIVE